MKVNQKDLAAGTVFIGLGLLYGIVAYRSLPIGKATNMGPGYFPIVLSGILVLLGAVVALRTIVVAPSASSDIGPLSWRPIVMLSLATIIFATFLRALGMLPTVFVTSLLASFASSRIRVGSALLVSAGIAVFCTAVFVYGIKLPIPTFGSFFER